MSNPTGKGGFGERKHQIWKGGRPPTFDALRELARKIAHEPAKTKDGNPIVIDGHVVTNAELLLRLWVSSQDFRKQQGFLEVAFGKVPLKAELTGADGKPLFNMQEIVELMAQAEKMLAEGEMPEPPTG
jgi:hypothetical protein